MFKTARFKIHHPSRHKEAMLMYALTTYHDTLKRVLEAALADAELTEKASLPDRNGRNRVNKFQVGKLVRRLVPKDWALAPVRDYLIGDAQAMLMSHFKKLEKGKHKSNPPTLPDRAALSVEGFLAAYKELTTNAEFPLKPGQEEKIESAKQKGCTPLARKLVKRFQGYALSRAAGDLLRSQEERLPRPIEFTHAEFKRGAMLARKGNNFYLLVRLFSDGHRYRRKLKLDEGFVDWRTREDIGGRIYPGVILPLELGREYHEVEFLEHGRPQSTKLIVRKGENGRKEFFAHIAFEFTPQPLETQTVLGIDRGAVKIGAATVIDTQGRVVESGIALEGETFSREMALLRARIAEKQKRGHQRGQIFRLRGRKADIAIGEYANRVVETAVKHRAQVVLEKIEATAMARFLTQSQFAKLKACLSYKAERVGLPAPIEVPAAYTSQTCARCGHRARENRPKKDAQGKSIQDVFHCVACEYDTNADDNASEVIALRGLHQMEKGGRFQTFDSFQQWLKAMGRDGTGPARDPAQ
jgi:IS605 OrfB family transposase